MSTGTHSYYDWQISTLMLAYDVVEPLGRDDAEAHGKRLEAVQLELHQMVTHVLPESYRQNPEAEFTPQIIMMLTRATLQRAAKIVGILESDPNVA